LVQDGSPRPYPHLLPFLYSLPPPFSRYLPPPPHPHCRYRATRPSRAYTHLRASYTNPAAVAGTYRLTARRLLLLTAHRLASLLHGADVSEQRSLAGPCATFRLPLPRATTAAQSGVSTHTSTFHGTTLPTAHTPDVHSLLIWLFSLPPATSRHSHFSPWFAAGTYRAFTRFLACHRSFYPGCCSPTPPVLAPHSSLFISCISFSPTWSVLYPRRI